MVWSQNPTGLCPGRNEAAPWLARFPARIHHEGISPAENPVLPEKAEE